MQVLVQIIGQSATVYHKYKYQYVCKVATKYSTTQPYQVQTIHIQGKSIGRVSVYRNFTMWPETEPLVSEKIQ